jgi:endogenous inhibitor of DNA gyrase (YacG/DUF329 family)
MTKDKSDDPIVDNRKEFLSKLHSLLEEFHAEINAKDHWEGYPECGQDVRMTVEFMNWNTKDIDLGAWIDKEDDIFKSKQEEFCVGEDVLISASPKNFSRS